MNEILIKNINGDRIIKINISNHRYFVFTVFHCNIVIIENTDDGPVLLCNRHYSNYEEVIKSFDKIIIDVTKMKDCEDFISGMDTYINLSSINIKNDTIEEILGIYNIVIED